MKKNLYKMLYITPGRFWLENKITENQWKIAETIYTPFQVVHFWPVLTVSSNFLQFLPRVKYLKSVK